jgi:hypothetical protein
VIPDNTWFEDDADWAGGPSPWSSGARRERRRYGRRATQVPLWRWVRKAQAETADSAHVPIMVRDVGLGGVRFEAYALLDIGSEVVVHIDVRGRRISAPCRVNWSEQIGAGAERDRHAYGCSFLMVSPRDAQDLVNAAPDMQFTDGIESVDPAREDHDLPLAA